MAQALRASAAILLMSLFGCAGPTLPPFEPSRPYDLELDLGNGVSMGFILVPAGEFVMGSPAAEAHRESEEARHTVKLTRPFYMGVTEVTQAQWEAVMGTSPWRWNKHARSRGRNAASCVTWYEAADFCWNLGQKTGKPIRLPTEAEWEYACRAGSTTAYCFGDDPDELDRYAWYTGNAHEKGQPYAHAVGRKLPNAWGLYDMHGNVWEWCNDRYGAYPAAAATDPVGVPFRMARVIRGGAFATFASSVRSAARDGSNPHNRISLVGFRVAASLPAEGD